MPPSLCPPKKFYYKYRWPRAHLPKDPGAAQVVDDTSLEVWGLDGVVAAVGHGVRVYPVEGVDPVTGHPPMSHPFAAGVSAL